MKYRYSRFVANLADDVDLEKLLARLSDLLLSSGFNNPWDPQSDDDRAMQALHDAILDALLNGGALSDEMADKLCSHDGTPESIERQRAADRRARPATHRAAWRAGLHQPDRQARSRRGSTARAAGRGPGRDARFEVTDKALDFLGYRALRDLLGSMGRSASGRHDTRDLDTGIEAGGPPREYEFGDTMNLDASATVLNAVRRALSRSPSASGGFRRALAARSRSTIRI